MADDVDLLDALARLASEVEGEARGMDAAKVRMLAGAVRQLGMAVR